LTTNRVSSERFTAGIANPVSKQHFATLVADSSANRAVYWR